MDDDAAPFDDDPTKVDRVLDFEDLADTHPYASEHWLAGYARGKGDGVVQGRVEFAAALRESLLASGVEPHEVEPIVDRVKRRLPGAMSKVR